MGRRSELAVSRGNRNGWKGACAHIATAGYVCDDVRPQAEGAAVVNGTKNNFADNKPAIPLSPALQRFLGSMGLVTLIDPESGTLTISRAELLTLLGVSQSEIENFLAQARASSNSQPDPDLVLFQRIIERRRIGRNIKKIRQSMNLSLRDMKTLAGISPTYLSQLERGLRAASVDTLVQIAIVLHTTLAEIVVEWPLW